MSEHEHGHPEHEPWKAKLDHAFRELKEADDAQAARLRHNEAAVQRIVRDVFPPVFAQFEKDAAKHGFQTKIAPLSGNKQRLTLQGPSSCTIDFWTEATADEVKVMAHRQGDRQINLLVGKSPEHFQEADLGEYLTTQLLAIKPKK